MRTFEAHLAAAAFALVCVVFSGLPAFEARAQTLAPCEEFDLHGCYLEILELWAKDSARAPRLLADFESRFLDGRASPRALEFHQKRFIGDVVSHGSPEALIPVALLHQETLFRHLSTSHSRLAQLARKIHDQALIGLRRGWGRERSHDVIVRLLTRLAVIYLGSSRLEEALDSYQRALDLEPESPTLLLGCGAVAEKLVLLEDAQNYLERLLKVAPGDPEGTLRLALVQLRQGRQQAARSGLEALVDGSQGATGRAWPRAVAFQELAQLLAQDGDRASAVRLLRQGREAFPENRALTLELSFFVDREESRRLLQGLEEAAGERREGEISPRARYNNWPLEGMDEVTLQLSRDFEATRGALLAWLRAESESP